MNENITPYEHHYHKKNEMNTKRIATPLRENSFKQNTSSPIEGIYEDIVSSESGRNTK